MVYLQCVVRNRATLVGYLLFFLGIPIFPTVFLWMNTGEHSRALLILAVLFVVVGSVVWYISALFLLVFTQFGFWTYNVYRETLQTLKTSGVSRYGYCRWYCSRVGTELAFEHFRKQCPGRRVIV